MFQLCFPSSLQIFPFMHKELKMSLIILSLCKLRFSIYKLAIPLDSFVRIILQFYSCIRSKLKPFQLNLISSILHRDCLPPRAQQTQQNCTKIDASFTWIEDPILRRQIQQIERVKEEKIEIGRVRACESKMKSRQRSLVDCATNCGTCCSLNARRVPNWIDFRRYNLG